jgi:peptidoglycan-associated lipoprotein
MVLGSLLLVVILAACGGNEPPVARPTPPPLPPAPAEPPPPPTPPPPPLPSPPPVPVAPPEEDINSRSLDELNRDSPLAPVFYGLDSSEVDAPSQDVLNENADLMRRYPNWVVTIEGHCDERGTAEYNLALGERRALAARSYLISLGIAPDRVRTVSYGNEFPFDPGHDDAAWAQNRRAHFVITSK